MKNIFIIFFLLIIFAACKQQQPKILKINEIKDFVYVVEFNPAFDECATILIEKKGNHGIIKYKNGYNFDRHIIYTDSNSLTESDLLRFYKDLDSVKLDMMKNNEHRGEDGVTVRNTYIQNGKENKFSFWSPEKEYPEHRIVEAVLNLTSKKFSSYEISDYLDILKRMFFIGLEIRKISNNPLEVRITGSIYKNDGIRLMRFINTLPPDSSIIIDVRYFKSIIRRGFGTTHNIDDSLWHNLRYSPYPKVVIDTYKPDPSINIGDYLNLFKNYNRINKKILWVASYTSPLINIGVDPSKIYSDIDSARLAVKSINSKR